MRGSNIREYDDLNVRKVGCKGPDWYNAYQYWRDCTFDGAGCGMDVVDYDACGYECYGVYASNGEFIYTECPDKQSSKSRLYYDAVITTFLPRY